MERLPSQTQAKRLYQAAKNMVRQVITPDVPLYKSDHYRREHFIPFEEETYQGQLFDGDTLASYCEGDTASFPYTGPPTEQLRLEDIQALLET